MTPAERRLYDRAIAHCAVVESIPGETLVLLVHVFDVDGPTLAQDICAARRGQYKYHCG